MELIELTEDELNFLSENYPSLFYCKKEATITGTLNFDLTFPDKSGVRIKDSYKIEILLKLSSLTMMPIVRETEKKLINIAKRKKLNIIDLHLNSENGEMCLIIPPKVKERYPNGFNLREFLHHIEEHLYWISYFDRYEKKVWSDQKHGSIGYVQLFKENKKRYRNEVKTYCYNKPLELDI